MANCIAEATGHDKGKSVSIHKTGSIAATAKAATYLTEAVAFVRKDGSGFVEVRSIKEQRCFYRFEFGPESERVQKDAVQKALDGEL